MKDKWGVKPVKFLHKTALFHHSKSLPDAKIIGVRQAFFTQFPGGIALVDGVTEGYTIRALITQYCCIVAGITRGW